MNKKNTSKIFGNVKITTSLQMLDYIKGMTDAERSIFFNELLEEPYLELDGNTADLEAYYDYNFEKISL